MDLVNISVVGRTLKSSKWNSLYDILNEARDENILTYDLIDLDINASNINNNSDAYIYIATTPKIKDKPYIRLPLNICEDDLIAEVNSLASRLFKSEDDIAINNEDNNQVNPSQNEMLINTEDSKINGLALEINGKDVTLNKQDFTDLKEMLRLCDIYGFKVKEVLLND